jgi:hypothetical protein
MKLRLDSYIQTITRVPGVASTSIYHGSEGGFSVVKGIHLITRISRISSATDTSVNDEL